VKDDEGEEKVEEEEVELEGEEVVMFLLMLFMMPIRLY